MLLLRGGETRATFDLYPFVLRGELPAVRLQNNDTIVVREKGIAVNAGGESRNAARFELRPGENLGETLATLAEPLPTATHVSISGTRSGAPYNLYLSMRDFRNTPLSDGDTVQFLADTPGDTIMVAVTGSHTRGFALPPAQRRGVCAICSSISPWTRPEPICPACTLSAKAWPRGKKPPLTTPCATWNKAP